MHQPFIKLFSVLQVLDNLVSAQDDLEQRIVSAAALTPTPLEPDLKNSTEDLRSIAWTVFKGLENSNVTWLQDMAPRLHDMSREVGPIIALVRGECSRNCSGKNVIWSYLLGTVRLEYEEHDTINFSIITNFKILITAG